MKIRVVFSYFI